MTDILSLVIIATVGVDARRLTCGSHVCCMEFDCYVGEALLAEECVM